LYSDLVKQYVIRRAALAAKLESLELLKSKFDITNYCFDKQINFINDSARFKTAVCSRRAGKTVSCAADLINTCLSEPQMNLVYISKTRGSSKRIIWKDLLYINKQYDLGAKQDNTELTLTYPNGSMIYLTGAKDSAEIDKFRGMSLKKVYIDECQSFPSYLRELIDDVLVPALIDHQGSLILIGTPSPTCAGMFFEAATDVESGYSHHHWTFKDNPFLLAKAMKANPDIKTADDILDFELKRRKTTLADPAIGREWLGLWLKDMSLQVYKFSHKINIYTELPKLKWNYVIGYDLGFDDADAGVVWAYHEDSPIVYLVDEFKVTKQDISQLARKIADWNNKYNPQKSVIDTGGLGKKITEELKKRYGFALEAADKVRKKEFVELMNSDMIAGKIKVPSKAMIISEWELLCWDVEEMANNKWVEDGSFENHLSDGANYSWKECYHFLYEAKLAPPKYGTPEWYKQEEKRLLEETEQAYLQQNNTNYRVRRK